MKESEHRHQRDDDCRRTEGTTEKKSPAAFAITPGIQRTHQPLETRFRVEPNRWDLHA